MGAQHADTSFDRECLELLFGILVDSGLPVSRLREVSADVCDGLKDSRRTWSAADLNCFTHLPHILSLWHLLPDYLDARAIPRPLKLFSSAKQPSLSKLIARVFPAAKPREVLSTLIRVNAVTRRGRYWLPCGRTLIFQSAHVARLRILSDLVRFLRTAQHNLAHHRGKLLQLSAVNPHIPVAEFPKFHARIHERARHFLMEQDTDLSRLEEGAQGSPGSIGVGVGVYAFRDPPSPGPAPMSAPRGKRNRQR